MVRSGQVKPRPQIELTAQAKAKASGRKFKLTTVTGNRAPGFISNLLNNAEFFGNQAALEPRYYMAPWPTDYYADLVRSGLLDSNGSYKDLFAHFRETDSFKKVATDLTETMSDCMFLVQGVLDNETKAPMGEYLLSKMDQCEGVDQLDAMDELWHQINANMKYP